MVELNSGTQLQEDFEIPGRLEQLARAASVKKNSMSPEAFKKPFAQVVNDLRGGL